MTGQPIQQHTMVRRSRRGFTLTELLVVIAIIAILAGLSFAGLQGATEQAREARTRAVLAKLDQLIMEKYDTFTTRSIRVNPAFQQNGATPAVIAQVRLYTLREQMRLELPDRISDLCTNAERTGDFADLTLNAVDIFNVERVSISGYALNPGMPSITRTYKRKAGIAIANGSGWTSEFGGAECLYLIVSTMRDGDKSALEFFRSEEIGDVDGDGMPEFLDGWGRPILFIRWAPGYVNNPDDGRFAPTLQVNNGALSPDPFDPLRVDPRWGLNTNPFYQPYALRPLIMSGGPDKEYSIFVNTRAAMDLPTASDLPNDPYVGLGTASGMSGDPDPTNGYGDDLTNHYQGGL